MDELRTKWTAFVDAATKSAIAKVTAMEVNLGRADEAPELAMAKWLLKNTEFLKLKLDTPVQRLVSITTAGLDTDQSQAPYTALRLVEDEWAAYRHQLSRAPSISQKLGFKLYERSETYRTEIFGNVTLRNLTTNPQWLDARRDCESPLTPKFLTRLTHALRRYMLNPQTHTPEPPPDIRNFRSDIDATVATLDEAWNRMDGEWVAGKRRSTDDRRRWQAIDESFSCESLVRITDDTMSKLMDLAQLSTVDETITQTSAKLSNLIKQELAKMRVVLDDPDPDSWRSRIVEPIAAKLAAAKAEFELYTTAKIDSRDSPITDDFLAQRRSVLKHRFLETAYALCAEHADLMHRSGAKLDAAVAGLLSETNKPDAVTSQAITDLVTTGAFDRELWLELRANLAEPVAELERSTEFIELAWKLQAWHQLQGVIDVITSMHQTATAEPEARRTSVRQHIDQLSAGLSRPEWRMPNASLARILIQSDQASIDELGLYGIKLSGDDDKIATFESILNEYKRTLKDHLVPALSRLQRRLLMPPSNLHPTEPNWHHSSLHLNWKVTATSAWLEYRAFMGRTLTQYTDNAKTHDMITLVQGATRLGTQPPFSDIAKATFALLKLRLMREVESF